MTRSDSNETPRSSNAAQAMMDVARHVVDSVRASVEARQLGIVPLGADDVPDFDQEFYSGTDKELSAEGIRTVGNYSDLHYKAKNPESESYYRIGLSEDGVVAAVWFALPAQWPVEGIAARCVLFFSWLGNGREIVTSSGTTETGLPNPPSLLYERVDDDVDLKGMLSIHRKHLVDAGAEGRVLNGPDEILTAWCESERQIVEFRQAVGLGLFEPMLRYQLGEEFDERGKPILDAILAHPEWWSGPTFDQEFPHLVVAKLCEPIEPLARGERYEEPLQQMLDARAMGQVTGGGSQLTEHGEIDYADVELVLSNVNGAIDHVKQVLEECGAPVGSELQFEKDGEDVTVPFGTQQGVAVYLDGVGLPDEVYDECNVEELEARINRALSPVGGAVRGWWDGSAETAMYIYGADAEAMFSAIEPILKAEPVCQNARVVIRFGDPNFEPRAVRLPLHE